MAKFHHKALELIFRAISRNDAVPPAFSPGKVKGILLVNTTAIGDTLLSTPAIRAVRSGFPDARISALVSKSAFQVLKGSPRIDEFIMHPGKLNMGNILRLPGLVKSLKRRAFDLVIVLHAKDPDAGPLAYLTGAPWRLGWTESRFSFLFTMAVPTTAIEHGVDIKLKHLERLGVRSKERSLEMFLSREDELEAEAVLKEIEKRKRPFAVIHPFGSKEVKWWPLDKVERFSGLLAGRFDLTPVIIGDASTASLAEKAAEKCNGISTAGKLTLRGAAALMARAAFVLSTDSGPMHMAQALGVPTIALFGPDDPRLTGPLNGNSNVVRELLPCAPCRKKQCIYPEVRCMTAISPEKVLSHAEKLVFQRMHTRA
ncbi:MAG: hypothetical protein A2X99_01490 [Deltaproteobacteria bacterium GWB2_55_19]|nr:MAG: hypothetical protein A2X99_01490 [Deltaproteobacteria bacterium GWB2_55_19]HAO93760.1 hypothetical protein [Deltaproteobacteria bacterium]